MSSQKKRIKMGTKAEQQKALEVLNWIARYVADFREDGNEKRIAISTDWGLGSATISLDTGGHTHIGVPYNDQPEDEAIAIFVDQLHALLTKGQGLSWTRGEK